jgi:hypothetical protein
MMRLSSYPYETPDSWIGKASCLYPFFLLFLLQAASHLWVKDGYWLGPTFMQLLSNVGQCHFLYPTWDDKYHPVITYTVMRC